MVDFLVLRAGTRLDSSFAPGFYLTEDNWNDWFEYRTQYFLQYRNHSGQTLDIGLVKIGQFAMSGDRPALPQHFEKLSGRFFSLGQNDSYYENLKHTGPGFQGGVLEALGDVAFDLALFRRALSEDVMVRSLLRSVTASAVTGQFNRIARGGAQLSTFRFEYRPPAAKGIFWEEGPRASLKFEVQPNSHPPSNVHVLIGRNGVGKTHMLRTMIASVALANPDPVYVGEFVAVSSEQVTPLFANLVSIAFSAFDSGLELENAELRGPTAYTPVNIRTESGMASQSDIAHRFAVSAYECSAPALVERWLRALRMLDSDPIFRELRVSDLAQIRYDLEVNYEDLQEAYDRFVAEAVTKFIFLSSGHAVVLLAVTQLVRYLEEGTLVVMDEPEAHLHPPLLGTFVRILSDLLTVRNGVAIVATHSPVVLQEVPWSCVWRLQRSGNTFGFERLEVETFGENVGVLTSEVFDLEVADSGFHKMLLDAVNENLSFRDIVDGRFGGQVGGEGRAILRALIDDRDNGDDR